MSEDALDRALREQYGELTPERLLQVAGELVQRCPTATLAKNKVGNLAIVNREAGEYLGLVDLRTGEVELFEEVQPL
ncbi:hypothetical protein [Nocardia sp. NPDC057440]|uniref:hypothetical protein n=1 Tax=Nocardia sp. NPDC057440 TaxID=3346134 RepID=UPI003671E853